jgi:hypothetical protein
MFDNVDDAVEELIAAVVNSGAEEATPALMIPSDITLLFEAAWMI